MYVLAGALVMEGLLWALPGAGPAGADGVAIPAALSAMAVMGIALAILAVAYYQLAARPSLVGDLAYGFALGWLLLRQGAYLTDAATRSVLLGPELGLLYTLVLVLLLPMGLMLLPLIILGLTWRARWFA